jgi:hypothetical protein
MPEQPVTADSYQPDIAAVLGVQPSRHFLGAVLGASRFTEGSA